MRSVDSFLSKLSDVGIKLSFFSGNFLQICQLMKASYKLSENIYVSFHKLDKEDIFEYLCTLVGVTKTLYLDCSMFVQLVSQYIEGNNDIYAFNTNTMDLMKLHESVLYLQPENKKFRETIKQTICASKGQFIIENVDQSTTDAKIYSGMTSEGENTCHLMNGNQ